MIRYLHYELTQTVSVCSLPKSFLAYAAKRTGKVLAVGTKGAGTKAKALAFIHICRHKNVSYVQVNPRHHHAIAPQSHHYFALQTAALNVSQRKTLSGISYCSPLCYRATNPPKSLRVFVFQSPNSHGTFLCSHSVHLAVKYDFRITIKRC